MAWVEKKVLDEVLRSAERTPGAETSSVGATHDSEAEAEGNAACVRCESLDTVARGVKVTAAEPCGWRDAFLDSGAAGLKSRPRDDRDDRIAQLQAKLGAVTMGHELLYKKTTRLESGRPLAGRRSRR